MRPSIAYYKSKAKDVEGIGDVIYQLHRVGEHTTSTKTCPPMLTTHQPAEVDNKLGVGPDDTVALGLVYQF
ncbi:porin [Shigella flexneri]